MGVPNHPWAPIPKCMKMWKFKNVGRVACGRPTLLTTTKGGWSS